MVRECQDCERIIKGASRKYCSYCRNSIKVRNKREESYYLGDLEYSHKKREFNWKLFPVLLFISLVAASSFISSNNGDNNINIIENSTDTTCQYKEQQDTGKTTTYLQDNEGNKYENPVQAINFNGDSTSDLVAIPNCKISFVLRNTLDKEVSLKLSYIINHIKDIQTETLSKSLDLTLSPFEDYFISETIDYFAPGQSCSVDQNSLRISYQSNSQLELKTEKVYEEVCKKCGEDICLNDGEKCSSNSVCGSGICNIEGVCGTEKIVECSEGFQNCNNESCLKIGVKNVGELYSCEFECKTNYGEDGVCKISTKEKISKFVFIIIFLLIFVFIIYLILSDKRLIDIVRRLKTI